MQHFRGCGIQLCGAQKPLRLYSHPEQEAYIAVSFRISCRMYFFAFMRYGGLLEKQWMAVHTIWGFSHCRITSRDGNSTQVFLLLEPDGSGRKQYYQWFRVLMMMNLRASLVTGGN